jgi:GT2 family glycosyltransferase
LKPAIVVVTYNRPVSLKRLLSFLSIAIYDSSDVNLIISIDYQASELHNDVIKIARDFNWNYGFKKIIEHKKNLGLKAHVLSCGDLSEEYGAVIVLEDDIVVSPFFYDYALQSLQVYNENINIAGISLYAFEWSQVADRSFLPAPNGSDVFFFKMPNHGASFGQKECGENLRTGMLPIKTLKSAQISLIM